MLKKIKKFLTRDSLEKYIEWLVNYLCRNEAESIKGYVSNDVMWYFHYKVKKDVITKINRLPILFSLIKEHVPGDKKEVFYYCLKYKNSIFFIGNCGSNIYFSFVASSVPQKCNVIDLEKIMTLIDEKKNV